MPNVLKVLDASAQTHEVVLLERSGHRLRLQSPSRIAPGTATQLKLEGELLLCEVTASLTRNGIFEVWLQAREALRDSWDLDWRGLDSKESVMGSLVKLNAHLVFHEKQRAHRDSLQDSLKTSSSSARVHSIS